MDATWEYFYPKNKFQKYSIDSPLTQRKGNYYVLNVIFTDHGMSCIKLDSDDSNKLLVSSTSFDSLHGQDALAIYSMKGDCIQYHVCDTNLISTRFDAHADIERPSDDKTSKNYFFESSISHPTIMQNIFSIDYGDNQIKNINISSSSGTYNTACCTQGANITTSTFSNNTSTYRLLILGSIDCEMKLCNIISNVEKSSNRAREGLLYMMDGNLKVFLSIITNNKVIRLLGGNPDKSPSIELRQCYISDNIASSPNILNNVIESTSLFINILQHIQSYKCEADSIMTFMNIPPILKCTPITKRVNIYYRRIVYSLALTVMFIEIK